MHEKSAQWSARLALTFTALVLYALSADESSADTFDLAEHYEKLEYRIAMRDGIKLHTVVYAPRNKRESYPVLLVRTPYSAGPYGPARYAPPDVISPSEHFLREGYIFAIQDVRGTHMSEGIWDNFRPRRASPGGIDETTDAYDTIDWLVSNIPNNNGRVGQWGISYPGWYAVQSLHDPHPSLKAVSPQATTADPFLADDFHMNGAFVLIALPWVIEMSAATAPDRELSPEGWTGGPAKQFDYGGPWAYEFYLRAGPLADINEKYFSGKLMGSWDAFIEHPDYDGYWARRNALRNIGPVNLPVLNVGTWFDAYDPYGTFATYRDIEVKNPGNRSTLVAGPWSHGGWHRESGERLGDIEFGAKHSAFYNKEVLFPFFQTHLKGGGTWRPAEAIVFETGNNKWREFERWPPESTTQLPLYLDAGSGLSFDAPPESGEDAHDAYTSDPSKPVPFTQEISLVSGHRWPVADQRMVSTRPDVLTYQTAPLAEDITVAGPISVRLFTSTTGTDSDWFAKIIDVHPGNAPDNPSGVKMGGYQMLVGLGVMRGKYRNDLARPEPMRPNEVTPIDFTIWDKFHTFRKNHRIMVQIHSSWFPYFDRNPQQFMDIYRAGPRDYIRAAQRVYRSAEFPSHLVLPVLPGEKDP